MSDYYEAVPDDYYYMQFVEGKGEYRTGKAPARGLKLGRGRTEVVVEAVEADGTVVEHCWTKDGNTLESDGPIHPYGAGWTIDVRCGASAPGSTRWVRRRRHPVRQRDVAAAFEPVRFPPSLLVEDL